MLLTKKENSGVTVSVKTSPKLNCNGIHNNNLGHLDNVNWFPRTTWNTAPLTFTTKGLVHRTEFFIPQSLNHSLHDNFLFNYSVSTIILNQILYTQFLYICMQSIWYLTENFNHRHDLKPGPQWQWTFKLLNRSESQNCLPNWDLNPLVAIHKLTHVGPPTDNNGLCTVTSLIHWSFNMKPQFFILLTGLTVTYDTNTLRQNVHTNIRCVVSKMS